MTMPGDDAGDGVPTPPSQRWSARHPAATYTLARLGLFVLFLVPLILVTRNLFVSLITAAIASSVLSIFVLRRQRDALSEAIATRGDRAKQTMADRAASEDAWDDERRLTTEGDAARAADEGGGQPGTEPSGSARD